MKKKMKYIFPELKLTEMSHRRRLCAMSGGSFNPIDVGEDDIVIEE